MRFSTQQSSSFQLFAHMITDGKCGLLW